MLSSFDRIVVAMECKRVFTSSVSRVSNQFDTRLTRAKSVAGEKETLQLVCKTSEDKYSLHLRKYFSSVPSISTLHTMSKSSDLYKPQYAQSEQSQIHSVAVCYCRLSVFVSHMTLELVLLK